MPCYPMILRLWFPVTQIGWRVAAQYGFAAVGMAIGGWMAGHIYDVMGSYAFAFLGGFCFNIINLIIFIYFYLRSRKIEFQGSFA